MRAAVFALLLASCITIEPPDGRLLCGAAPPLCPRGYVCADGTCWRAGHEPMADLSASADDLARPADLAEPVDDTPPPPDMTCQWPPKPHGCVYDWQCCAYGENMRCYNPGSGFTQCCSYASGKPTPDWCY